MPRLSVFKELLQEKDLAGFWHFSIKSGGRVTELNSRECVLSRGASGVQKRGPAAALPQFTKKLGTLVIEEGKSISTWAMIT